MNTPGVSGGLLVWILLCAGLTLTTAMGAVVFVVVRVVGGG
jgi:hypothetical protein